MSKKSFSSNLDSVENPAYLFTGAPQPIETAKKEGPLPATDSLGSQNHIIPSRERRDRRLQLLLPQSLYDSVARYAASTGISVNETIISALQHSFVQETEGGKEPR